jgi:predicted DNA-binding transcriptional regulator AlpA
MSNEKFYLQFLEVEKYKKTKYFSVSETAEILGVGRTAIYNAITKKTIKPTAEIAGVYVFDKTEIRHYINNFRNKHGGINNTTAKKAK